MKILYFSYTTLTSLSNFTSNPRTGLSWIDSLLEELKKYEDISIAIALPINRNSFEKDQVGRIKIYGLPNHKEKSIFKKAYNRLSYAVESTKINNYIQKVVDDFDPDVIQIFGSENPFGLIIPELRKPVIMHLQGFLLVGQKKYFAGISKCMLFRYSSIQNLIFRRGSYNGFFTFRNRAKVEEKIITSCNYFMGRTDFDKRISSLLSPKSTYYHCEEFIRAEFFERQWNFPLGNEIVCISTLNGATYKGIDLLIEASMVLQKYASFSFKFKICGVSSNDEFIKILKRKYRKRTRFDNFEFLGRLSATELVAQLCNSNFYVHPSYLENSPNSVCEAMTLGMPIITTGVGGVDTIIMDKVEGIVVQEGDPYSFAAAIVELTNNYKYADVLGENAREKALKRHNPQQLVTKIITIYENIINENGKKGLP